MTVSPSCHRTCLIRAGHRDKVVGPPLDDVSCRLRMLHHYHRPRLQYYFPQLLFKETFLTSEVTVIHFLLTIQSNLPIIAVIVREENACYHRIGILLLELARALGGEKFRGFFFQKNLTKLVIHIPIRKAIDYAYRLNYLQIYLTILSHLQEIQPWMLLEDGVE
jgi:hypothetical protein